MTALPTHVDIREVSLRDGLQIEQPIPLHAKLQLLDAVKQVERTLGRQARVRWGPREIDVDILLFGDARVVEPGLEVPHRSMWDRLFVLAPLAELRPDLCGPDGRLIQDHLRKLETGPAVRSLGW